MDNLILSPEEAAVRARVGAERIREECRAGRLGHFKSGRRFKIPAARLDEWVAKQSEPKLGGRP